MVAEKAYDRPVQAQFDEHGNAERDDGRVGRPIGDLERGSAGLETHCSPQREGYHDRIGANGDDAFGRARQLDQIARI